MARCSQLLYITLVVFALVQIGECLKCYHCVDKLGGKCDEPSKNKVETKSCNQYEVCYIKNITDHVNGVATNVTIQRGCAHNTTCNMGTRIVNGTQGTCDTCVLDYCNSSPRILPTVLIVGFVAMFFANQFV